MSWKRSLCNFVKGGVTIGSNTFWSFVQLIFLVLLVDVFHLSMGGFIKNPMFSHLFLPSTGKGIGLIVKRSKYIKGPGGFLCTQTVL